MENLERTFYLIAELRILLFKNPPQADEYVRKEAAVGEDSKNILNVNF